MKSQFSSYIPESLSLKGKDLTHVPIFCEDCVLADPSHGYRVLGYRGKENLSAQTLPCAFGLSKKETDFLESALALRRPVLLLGSPCAVLCFGDLLDGGGILVAVRFHQSPAAVYRGASMWAPNGVICSPAFHDLGTAKGEETEEAFHRLREIMRSMELLVSGEVDPLELCRRAAAFSGCRLQLPAGEKSKTALKGAERLRLAAFLLCVFLRARSWSEGTAASGETEEKTPCYRLRVELSAHPSKQPRDLSHFSFLDLQAFGEYSAFVTPQGIALEVALAQTEEETLVHSFTRARRVFSFILEAA